MIAFRHAHADDLPALTEIYNVAVTETRATGDILPKSLEERSAWMQAHQDSRYPILVAESEGSVVGYASLSPWSSVPVYAHTVESSLYLAPAAQGKGLGTSLMRALLAEALRLGHHIVISRIWADNEVSLAMCRKCGYETVGVQKEVGRRDGRWEDCIIMQYRIP